MPAPLRFAPLALLVFPTLGYAQAGAASVIGLEIPAPTAPRQGHFLSGAYVVGAYTPLPTAGYGYGYGVQPYLRYQLGSSDRGRLRPYVQYSFTPYRMAAYAAGPFYGPEGAGLSANPGFAPLAARNAPYGTPYANGCGGLGTFSVGIPMQIGRSSAVLNVGGAVLEGFLKSGLW
ncbi:hypothetical protein [Hymenobacter rubidus]|uniref:hypothetical protein n=1 Tax=Hymenobacter rubidus TaxID=1441626 RepID=UPI00191E5A5F|nr:hypothetical protein [Hymenobacter rubidus]